MKLYSTAQVAAHSGATLRQLQWWDVASVLRPQRVGHRRLYTEAQLRAALRALMPVVATAVAGSMWVVRNGRKVQITQSERMVPHLAEQIGAVEKLEVKP